MKKLTVLLSLFVLVFVACFPRPSDPAEFISVNKERELKLLGTWGLTQLSAGGTPAPNQKRTLTFQNNGVLQMDLWEHRLTYNYAVAPDADHLTLTWTASTNPNDKPEGTVVQPFSVDGDSLSLNGDFYKRLALASGATLTPVAAPPAGTPTAEGTSIAVPVTPPSDRMPVTLGTPFTLRMGERARVTDSPNQFGIQFYGVSKDSRCPKTVDCVVAGEAAVQITFEEGELLHPPVFELTTTPPNNVKEIEGYIVTLVSLEPYPETTAPIPPSEYQATFTIEMAVATPVPQSTVTVEALAVVPLNQEFQVPALRAVRVEGADMQLTFSGVLEDSRCPSSVNCVQAGRALIGVRLQRNNELGFFSMSTMPPDARNPIYFQRYVVELVKVEPYPAAPDKTISTTDYRATFTVREGEPPTAAVKNEPFVLTPGQTIPMDGEDAQITLVRVSQDSRCPYPAMCFVQGDAVVELLIEWGDGTKQSFVLHTDYANKNERLPDTGLYGMELLALTPYPQLDANNQRIPLGEYAATLVWRKFATPPAPKPTAVSQTLCPALTAEEAEGILGEVVRAQPSDEIVIRAEQEAPGLDSDSYGLCGYVGEQSITQNQIPSNAPRIVSPEPADHAVTAGRLRGGDAIALMRIADILRAAKPAGDETSYLLLLTHLAAGDTEPAIENLLGLAKQVSNVSASDVDLGDDAAWIWYSFENGHYGALVVRNGDAFVVVQAVGGAAMTEAGAKEAMTAIAQKISNP